MITINNRLLLSTDFWKSFSELMKDKSFTISTKLALVEVKRKLAQKIDDIQEVLERMEDEEKMKVFKVTSSVQSDKIYLTNDDLDGFSAEDLYNLNSIITLEG